MRLRPALSLPLTAALLSCNGCISFELPNLVSDTVKTSKGVYRDLTGKSEKEAATTDTVSASYPLHQGESMETASKNCLAAARIQAQLLRPDAALEAQWLSSELIQQKDGSWILCKAKIIDAKPAPGAAK